MKRTAATLVFCLLAGLAAAQGKPQDLPAPPSEKWFSLAKTSSGYVAGGNMVGTLWAFHVRGNELKSLGTGSPPMFAVDGVILQVKAVSRRVLKAGSGNVLDAHKRYEQDHQAQATKGVAFTGHDLCRNAKFAHQQWIASVPGGISQVYVTFEVGDYVLMVVSPYEDEKRRQAVANTIDEVCRSFLVEKSG